MNVATDVTRARVSRVPPPRRVHLWSWASEFAGTAILLFAGVTIARWLFAPDSALSRAVPDTQWRMVIVGVAIGAVLALLIVSPLGRRSGGHLNPAITIAFWGLGAFPRTDVLGYIAAQLAGSVVGTALARPVWGPTVTPRPVSFGLIQPAAGVTRPEVFLAEAASVGLLVVVVAFLLASPRLARWTPWVVGATVGLIIAATGVTTGGSFNPARALGPAVLSGNLDYLLCYLIAPMVGAVLVTTVRSRTGRPPALTCRLCGDLRPIA
jgi:glycerol uptake facilitator-like aquaporin